MANDNFMQSVMMMYYIILNLLTTKDVHGYTTNNNKNQALEQYLYDFFQK